MRFISHDYGDKYGAGREAFRGVSVLWALVATLPWALLPLWDAVLRFWKFRNPTISRFRNLTVSQSQISFFASFGFLSLLAIVGFWCLTSRVLVYYLFPVIPVFVFFLVLHYRKDLLWRLVPWGVALTLVVVAGGLFGGMFFSDKMEGAKTEFHPLENHYAYEFYHGRKSDAELEPYRKAREEYLKRRAARKAAEAAKRAQEHAK